MTLATEYRGYTIRYGENDEKWWCSDIEFSHEPTGLEPFARPIRVALGSAINGTVMS